MLSQEKGISKYRSNLWERYVNGNLFSISPPFPLSNAVEENKKRRDAMQVLFRISYKIERKEKKQIKTRNREQISKTHPHNSHNSNSTSGVEYLNAHFSPSGN